MAICELRQVIDRPESGLVESKLGMRFDAPSRLANAQKIELSLKEMNAIVVINAQHVLVTIAISETNAVFGIIKRPGFLAGQALCTTQKEAPNHQSEFDGVRAISMRYAFHECQGLLRRAQCIPTVVVVCSYFLQFGLLLQDLSANMGINLSGSAGLISAGLPVLTSWPTTH